MTHPTHLETLSDGNFRCTSCRQVEWHGMVRHSSRCDVSPKQTESVARYHVAPAAEAQPAAPVTTQTPDTTPARFAAAARDGEVSRVARDEQDVVDAVRSHAISGSDALNRDF